MASRVSTFFASFADAGDGALSADGLGSGELSEGLGASAGLDGSAGFGASTGLGESDVTAGGETGAVAGLSSSARAMETLVAIITATASRTCEVMEHHRVADLL